MLKNFTKYYYKLIIILLVIGLCPGCTSQMEHSKQINQALKTMKSYAAKLGEPKVIADSLFFGTTKINNNYLIIDALKEKYDCTATFFVKKGNDFIRVSTDVMLEGLRAIGTKLDPNGPVIKMIKNGEPFYGVTEILGNKYETGYEPIKNDRGEILGAYYVGFQVHKK